MHDHETCEQLMAAAQRANQMSGERLTEYDQMRDELAGLREDHKVALADLAAARAECDEYRRRWLHAESVRTGVERVLDEVLGTEDDDGACAGLVEDVRYALAVARQQGRAEGMGSPPTATTAAHPGGDTTDEGAQHG